MAKNGEARLVQNCSGCGRDTRAKNGICATCWGTESRRPRGRSSLPSKTIEITIVTRFQSGRQTEKLITLDVIGMDSKKQVLKFVQEGEVFQVWLGLTVGDSSSLYHGTKRDDV